MIYILVSLVVVLFVILVAVFRAHSRIVFIPTPAEELGNNGEVSDDCTQHYHSYWKWFGKDEEGYYIAKKFTHFWWCTGETCPNDGDDCERPKPHQKWGVGPKIHDKSL
jgi:hypothetical protein